MSIFSDVGEEFKSASPGGKALMLVAFLVVAGLGYYVYLQKSGNSNNSGTLVPISDSFGNSGNSSSTGNTGTTTGTTTGSTGTTITGGNPPKSSNPVSSKPSGKYVTVTKWPSQFGTLWGIAQAEYGNGSLWTRIANAPQNKGINPNNLHVGQKVFVPK